jgi:hypothetical protein
MRAERQAKPPGAILSSCGCSLRQHASARNPVVKFTVQLRPTGSPSGQPNRVHTRRFCPEENRVTVYIELFGLVLRERKVGIKSMRYRSMRNRDPREWDTCDIQTTHDTVEGLS